MMKNQGPIRVNSPFNSQEEFNNALLDLQRGAKGIPFPKEYLKELVLLGEDKSTKLLEAYIQSILDRLKIPHVHEGRVTATDYFKHLRKRGEKLCQEADINLEIELSLAGGVVRVMLENVYKLVHERKKAQEDIERRGVQAYKSSNIFEESGALTIEHKAKIEKQKSLKSAMLKSTEFHLKQATLAEKETLTGPFVLGVGSDLDIYYDVKSKDGSPLTNQQKEAAKKIKQSLESYMREIEAVLEVDASKNPIKNTFMPEADLLDYHEQIKKVLNQGGSLLDTLAFRLTDLNDKTPKLKMPEGHADILKDYFLGFYEYLGEKIPKARTATQTTTTRGLRPLLSMPFLDVKDNTQIITELRGILASIQKGEKLEESALLQFQKMVRNANFQLGDNRPYREEKLKEETPMSLGLQIARELFKRSQGLSDKVRFLLPIFLPNMPIVPHTDEEIEKAIQLKKVDGANWGSLEAVRIDEETFKRDYTDNGCLYHGTSAEAGICVLRGGFVLSSKTQGLAEFGSGTYTTKHHETAQNYAKEDGFVIQMQLAKGNKKIIDWEKVDPEAQKRLSDEAKTKGYEHVFDMLRERDGYAVDVIFNGHVIVQNQAVIEVEKSLLYMLKNLENNLKDQIQKASHDDGALNMDKPYRVIVAFKRFNAIHELFNLLEEPLEGIASPGKYIEQIKPLMKKYYDYSTQMTYKDFDKFVRAQEPFESDFMPFYLKHIDPNGSFENYRKALSVTLEKCNDKTLALSSAIYIKDINLVIALMKKHQLALDNTIKTSHIRENGRHFYSVPCKIGEACLKLLKEYVESDDNASFRNIIKQFKENNFDLLAKPWQNDILSIVLESGKEVFIEEIKNTIGPENLITAISKGNIDVVNMILNMDGATLEGGAEPYWFYVFKYKRSGQMVNQPMLDFLLDHNVDVAIPCSQKEGECIHKPISILDTIINSYDMETDNKKKTMLKVFEIVKNYPNRIVQAKDKTNMVENRIGIGWELDLNPKPVLAALINCNHGQTLANAVSKCIHSEDDAPAYRDMILLLLEYGAVEVKKTLELYRVEKKYNVNSVKIPIEHIAQIIRKGHDINEEYLKNTLKLEELHLAVIDNNIDKVKLLISEGASVDNSVNELGLSPLMLAGNNPKMQDALTKRAPQKGEAITHGLSRSKGMPEILNASVSKEGSSQKKKL